MFDFDGVIADSEIVANRVLAQTISELGQPTSLDDALRDYCGKSFADVLSLIEARTGKPAPENFAATLFDRTLEALQADVNEVVGAKKFIASLTNTPICIASSSHPRRLDVCLEKLRLADVFRDRVFSATMVERGKPAPDLFLYAAKQIGMAPDKCLVIEDSSSGVIAGKAAGMHVVGLTAASHLGPDHGEVLRAAGADEVASDWSEVEQIFAAWRSAQAASFSINSG